MNNQLDEEVLARQSWLNCIGQLNDLNNENCNDFIENPEPQIEFSKPQFNNKMPCFKSQFTSKLQTNMPGDIQTQKQSKRPRTDLYSEQEFSSERVYSSQNQVKQQEENSRQSEKTNQRQNKTVKQSVYSKNYRQRKKQQLKILQEQNNFLKKKINQLQFRLREKQLEINRLKFPAMEKDLTVQKLNEQFLQKTNLLLSKTAIDPINYGKTVYTPSDVLYLQFLKSYDQHGFGGRRKKNILNYYFNQMLQALMRDSERYLFLMCNKSRDPKSLKGLQTYQQIDSIFIEVMGLDEQKIQRLNYFSKGLHPYMVQIKQVCGQIYNDFKKINNVLDRVHNFMKQTYLTNMDFARKRIQFQNWFDSQKHSKLMRRLRSQWLQFVKQEALNCSDGKKRNNKGSKKTKITLKNGSSAV